MGETTFSNGAVRREMTTRGRITQVTEGVMLLDQC